MKAGGYVWSAVVVLLLAACCGAAAVEIGPDSGHVIVVGKGATVVSEFAAKELRHYLEKITGHAFPIRSDDEVADTAAPLILVGPGRLTEPLGIEIPTDRPEGFVIRTVGNRLVLLGDDHVAKVLKRRAIPFDESYDRKGTLYAVYAFLERFAGVRWLWPGESGEVVPKAPAIHVGEVNMAEAPDFYTRWLPFCYGSTGKSKPYGPISTKVRTVDFPYWCMRNRLSRGLPGGWGHAWAAIIGQERFNTHPEYYALIDCERRPPLVRNGRLYLHGNQVCTSNPEVVKIFVDYVRKIAAPDEVRVVSVCPNDGVGFCECDACRALDAPDSYTPEQIRFGEANLSNRVYRFVNQIAREVKKTHPKVLLGIYAYSIYKDPPTAVDRIEDNVLVILTQHSTFFNDPEFRQRTLDRREKWTRLAGSMACYEYLGGDGWQLPHPVAHVLAEDIADLKSKGYLSYRGGTATNFSNKGLDYYLAARLLWDVDQDVDAIIDDYCRAGFGGGARKMREYFDFIERTWTEKKVGNWAHAENVAVWTPEVMATGYRLLDEAEKAAETAADAARVRFVRAGHDLTAKMSRYFGCIMRLIDAGLPVYLRGYKPRPLKAPPTPGRITEWVREAHEAQEDLFAFAQKHKDTCVLQANYLDYVAGARFGWKKSIEDYYKTYVTESGNRMLLPLAWKFKPDPRRQGEDAGWWKPGFDDAAWADIRTDAFWEKQGYGKEKYGTKDGYNGWAWYRLGKVNVPARYAGGKCFLRFGAVDESCRVYVNGARAAEFVYDEAKNPDSWSEPIEFDVTPHVRFGGDNDFAVLVTDEEGAGGIWRRVSLRFEGFQKTLLEDGFEGEEFGWGPRVHGDCEHRIVNDAAFAGERSLFVHVKGQLPDHYMSLVRSVAPVEGGKQYKLSLLYRLAGIGENEAYVQARQRRQAVPKVRLIFIDANDEKTTDNGGYVWIEGPWKENVPEWTVLQRIFTTPPRTHRINISLKFECPGRYWIDDVRLQEF